ncbi:MAG: amidase, partial [Methylococcales bacterium]|nr:amidase [Methylococcales bacterium]
TESEAVTALRKAGALIMGKTVTTEFAYFGAGATRNPHNLAHTPGGSSSGSAAAVGAKICPLTFGAQTIGSINRPASFCGAVGYKPSYDRISRAGVIPLAPSLDHIGIFAEDIAGISHIAPFLTDQWQQPAITDKQPVLGVPIGLYLEQASSEAVTNLWQTVWDLRKKGVIVTKVRAFPDLRDIVTRHRLINAAEAAQVHAQWYDQYKSLYHPKTVELIERGQAVSPDALATAKTGQSKLRQQLTTFMDKHQLDLWLAPAATGTAPLGLTNTGNPVMNLPWSHSGLPALNFPNGKDKNGLPFGLQLVGRWYEDEKLIAWAKMIQKKISE